jgi:pimeloyl-ACP methyl ester carboxylesterase
MHALVSAEPVPSDRPAVVLVHGLGVSSRYMIPIAEHLALDFPVYAPDLPGFGRSDKPPHALTIRELADALAAWVDAAELSRAILVGNSLGNEIIVELALRHPEKVERVVLQGLTPEPGARNAPQQVWRYMATNPFEQPPLGWIAMSDYMICGIRRFVRTFRYMLQDRIEEKLPRVHVPALVVRGSHDQIVSQRWSEEATRLLPNARLVVIPGAGHAINFSYPAALQEAILPFLRGETATIRMGECPVSHEARPPYIRSMTPAHQIA